MIDIIDLIIPLYNVKKEYLCRCLSSVQMQTIIPHVVIVDDCSSIDYSDIIETFSNVLDLTYIKLEENKGSGYARQYGLDHSYGDFIMFSDSDDLMYTSFSVERLYDEISRDESIDFVTGSFIQETGLEDCPLVKCNQNAAWVFARIYRRSFLDKYNLRFNNTRLNEDVSFIQLCYACSSNNKTIKDSLYVWKNNEDSLTRSVDGEYKSSGIFSFAENLYLAHKEKKLRNVHENDVSLIQVIDALCVLYFYLVRFTYEDSYDRCNELMKMIQQYYDEVGYNKEWYISRCDFAERYMTSQIGMKDVCYKYIPKFTILEMLDDLDENSVNNKTT